MPPQLSIQETGEFVPYQTPLITREVAGLCVVATGYPNEL